jgi:dipeptidase E
MTATLPGQGGLVKLLLTSAGVRNDSIRAALTELLGKPIAEASALCIPTAMYGHPMVGPGIKPWEFITGRTSNPMVDLGWKSVGILELTALPSLDEQHWLPTVRDVDALLVAGGDVLYLCHWMRQSGLADLLPDLAETVWVGSSAGSMVLTPEVGDDFIQWRPADADLSTLGVVDFALCPHLAADGMPGNSMAEAQAWAATISSPAYVIDDETAIQVVDGKVDVVSEGQWTYLPA